MPRSITCCLALTLLTGVSALAQDGGATIIPKREVNEVLLQGLDRLATGRAVSDLVVRHLNVGGRKPRCLGGSAHQGGG